MVRTDFRVKLRVLLGVFLVFAYVAITAFRLAITTDLDHDEHMFLTSAFLVASAHLQPYGDFPYFHMPNLVYFYTLFFFFTDYPFLAARLFAGVCAVGIAVVLFALAWALCAEQKDRLSRYIPASCVLLFANSQLFAYTVPYAWNHMQSILCALLSFVCYRYALRRQSWIALLLSGVCLGLALGIRLTFAPLVFPFAVALLVWPPIRGAHRLFALSLFGLGVGLANLPALYFLIVYPRQFLFENVSYQAVWHVRYQQEMGYTRAMTLGGKLLYGLNNVLNKPTDFLIVVVAIYVWLGVAPRRLWDMMKSHSDLVLLVFMLPFLALGSLAPTPSWYQYFFAPVPFLILLIPFSLAYIQNAEGRYAGSLLVMLAAALSCLYSSIPKTPASASLMFRPALWVPVQLHTLSCEIDRMLGSQREDRPILTIAPLYAVETKLAVYPQFATGPFVLRAGHMLSPIDRQDYGAVSEAEINTLVTRNPPRAILTNTKDNDAQEEAPLIRAAQYLGYEKRQLTNGSVLWMPPSETQAVKIP